MQIFLARFMRTRKLALFLLALTVYSPDSFADRTFVLDSDNWSLISLPFDSGIDGSIDSLFGDDLPRASYGSSGSWAIFGFDATTNAYRELSLTDSLKANTGYWIFQTGVNSVELDLPDFLSPPEVQEVQGCPDDQPCVVRTLVEARGDIQWNLIGASAAEPLRFGDTRFQQDNSVCQAGCTPEDAIAANLIGDFVVRYASSGYERVTPSTELQPWDGIWLPVLTNSPSLVWLLPQENVNSPNMAITAAEKDAARLLMQGSFGPTDEAIENVISLGGPAAWVDSQLLLPKQFHLPDVNALYPDELGVQQSRYETFWKHALNADDQLRQRVAFALSQILVISDRSAAITSHADLAAGYYDVLINHAFGNYRDLLYDVTLNPAMGLYLSMLGNGKPDVTTGLRADENYARELMQLFTIGLVGLNLDGSEREGVVTYTQPDVENLARALTGWFWSNKPWRSNTFQAWWPDRDRMTQPMMAMAEYHDTDAKTVLGTAIPAGLTAESDLNMVLDILFNHPNVGPFVSSQLIKRLVTSNPSPAYIRRVATVFNNNGSGVRGDLSAVIRTILLDAEARSPTISNNTDFGKLREPLLRYAHVWRAFSMTDRLNFRKWLSKEIPQIAPLTAPSVFNYYSPSFSPPGAISQANLVAPEFQINSGSSLNQVNRSLMTIVINDRIKNIPTRLNLDNERPLLDSPSGLLNHLDRILCAGKLTAASRQKLTRYIESNKDQIPDEQLLRDVIGLVVTSTEFAIQR